MLHSQLIAETGGVDGLREEGMLESAMNVPFQSLPGRSDHLPGYDRFDRTCPVTGLTESVALEPV